MKFNRKIEVSCRPSDIWTALTNPESVMAFLFGSYPKTDWQVGSEIGFYMNKDGTELKIIDGIIRKYHKNKLLRHSLFPLTAEYPNELANHIDVEYRIEKLSNGVCELTITQDGFETAAEGELRFEHAQAGWDQALPKLKAEIERIAKLDIE